MNYVMITHWDRHWDNLRNNETYFHDTMFRSGMSRSKTVENTSTLFIKLNKDSRKPEKAWRGLVFGFKPETDRIRFRVEIESEVSCPSKYNSYREGWYAEEELPGEGISLESTLNPPFFDILRTTNDWGEFEENTFRLLKLLGIHEIYKYEKQKEQLMGFSNLVI